MTDDRQRPRTAWAVRGILPMMLGGNLIGLGIGAARGDPGLGMSVGMGVGSVLGLVVGLVFHPDEFRWRRGTPHDGTRQPPRPRG